MKDLTQQQLKELFSYNQKTGELYRKKRAKNQPKRNGPAGYTDPKGYRYLKIDSARYAAHRIIWCMVNGEWPKGSIDHINQNPSDNRIKNLRVVDHSENAKNRKNRRDNKSGVPGVCWHKSKRKWVARINTNFKRLELGSYSSLQEAIKARKAAEIDCGYHENHGGNGHGS